MFQRPVDGALFMFQNFCAKVFPLQIGKKTPAFNGWQEWAENCTEKKIKNFGTANPSHNWGVYCGASGLLVIDIDDKEGKVGSDSMKKLIAENDKLTKTLTVTTTTGGKHFYYEGMGKSTVSTIAKDIDTRGEGGFVVAPGSRINDRQYELDYDLNTPIVPLPAWFNKLLKANSTKPKALADDELITEGERNNTLTSLAGTMRARGMGYQSILAALTAVNENQLERPLPSSEIELIANSVAKYAPEIAQAATDFMDIKPSTLVKTANNIRVNNIPKRSWIMSKRFVRKFISVIVARGGVGKSSLSMMDAVAIATGKPITGFEIKDKGAVWIYNTEDPMDELERKLAAISIYHEIPLKDMKDVHITSGRDQPLLLVKQANRGLVINQGAIDSAVKYIKDNKIVLFIADPFVRTHEVSENDNMAIDKVVKCFQSIADRANCAVCIVHHMRKPGSTRNGSPTAGEMASARGASALTDAARIAHTLETMTEVDSRKFNVDLEKYKWYVRLDDAKANLSAPTSQANWYKRVSVDIMNGDNVGSLEVIHLQDDTAKKRKQKEDMEVRDMAMCLSEVLPIGERRPAKDVFALLEHNDKFNNLFNGCTLQTGVKKIIKAAEQKPLINGKMFTYMYQADKRQKHWIICSDAPSLDFLR